MLRSFHFFAFCGNKGSVTTLLLAVGLSYIVIAFALSILYVYGFRRSFAGNFWGALIVAIIGAFFGGLVDFLFADIIEQLRSVNGVLNIFPPIIAATIVLSIFASLSEKKDTYD